MMPLQGSRAGLEKAMKKILIFCFFVPLLCACSTGSPPAAQYGGAPASTINLDVLTLTDLDRSAPPAPGSPYTKNNFRPTIASAARQWLTQHLAAVGTTGEATVVLKDASLTSQALPYTKDLFTRQQASKYIAHAEVEITVKGHEGYGQVTAEATHFETLPENSSPIERQDAYTRVLNGLMHDLGVNLDAAIHDHIGDFVVTAPVLDNSK
jgi:hypothetical protein